MKVRTNRLLYILIIMAGLAGYTVSVSAYQMKPQASNGYAQSANPSMPVSTSDPNTGMKNNGSGGYGHPPPPNPIPLPPAMWLLGSAVMAVFTIGRKKTT